MRASLVLLVALMACSDSSGPHSIPVLTTHLSSSDVSVGSGLTASLTASNPTDTTLHLFFSTPPVGAEIRVGGVWQTGTPFGDGFVGPPTSTDTLSLAPDAAVSLGSIGMTILPAAFSTTPENFTLTPGTYDVRACYSPLPSVAPQGGQVVQIACGNTVKLTVTP